MAMLMCVSLLKLKLKVMNWNGMKVYPLLMKILASTHTNVDLFPGKPLVFDVYLWFIGDF